jgi:hypothetical protein
VALQRVTDLRRDPLGAPIARPYLGEFNHIGRLHAQARTHVTMGRIRGARSVLQHNPMELTDEEVAFGFELRESATGVRAVVRAVGVGLEAVKRCRVDGTIEYVVCDVDGHKLYAGAASVAELRLRFFRA